LHLRPFSFLNLIPQKRWPLITAFVAAGLVGWAAFLLVVTNQEKLSSSVVRQIMRAVKDSKELREMLGEAIRPQPEWWLNGDPWIEGSVSTMLLLYWFYDGGRKFADDIFSPDSYDARQCRCEFPIART
jgi:Cytochrome oxidase complex assembly protein 1